MKKKRLRYSRKRIYISLFLFLFLLGLGIGYSLISTNLKIDGLVHIKQARWDVHFANYQAIDGSVEPLSNPTVTGTNITFSAKVNGPGDFYGFTIDVTNQGTINANINSFSLTPDFSNVDYIDAEISYINGDPIVNNDILLAGTTKTIKVLLSYKDGIDENLYPTVEQSFNVVLNLNYVQNTDYTPNFQTDSWTTIAANARHDKSMYPVGSTRTFEMDIDGDNVLETYTLRVSNNTTPGECSNEGFSETACGFVLEFQDIISLHRMNLITNGTTIGTGNNGGWEYSDMRAYLNSTTYEAGNIDYSVDGIYNKLPDNIRISIIPTVVVSGYGPNDESHGNYITTDNLYLLAPHELMEDSDNDDNSGINYYDKSYSNTRQLDYYDKNSSISKKYGGSLTWWWLRSSYSNYVSYFYDVTGNVVTNYSHYNGGVSPAFRIAR